MDEVNRILNSLNNRINDSNNVISTLQKQIENMKEHHQKQIENMKENHQKQILKLNGKISDINVQMNVMKKSYEKEVAKLNDKIDYLLHYKEKFFYLKGRFIYKSFCDFIFLIFNINVEMKLEEKKALLEKFAIKKQC